MNDTDQEADEETPNATGETPAGEQPGSEPGASRRGHLHAVPDPEPGKAITPLPAKEVLEGKKLYEELIADLLDDSDWQTTDRHGAPLDHPFLKKSGWRKIKRAFNISMEKRESVIDRDGDGRPLRAEVWVRATAPNGIYEDGDGYCSADESRFNGRGAHKLENDLRATATTRAKNRAIADLVGMGEVSAEEAATAAEQHDRTASAAAGAPASQELKRVAYAALLSLTGGERDTARKAGAKIAEPYGYLPAAAGQALCLAAAAVASQAPTAPPPHRADTPPGQDDAGRDALRQLLRIASTGRYQPTTLAALGRLLFDRELEALDTDQIDSVHTLLSRASAAAIGDDRLEQAISDAAATDDRAQAHAQLASWLDAPERAAAA